MPVVNKVLYALLEEIARKYALLTRIDTGPEKSELIGHPATHFVCDITHEMCGWVTYQLGFFGPCVDPRKQGILPGYFFEQCVQDFVYNRHDKEPVYFLDFQPASDFYAAEAVFRDGNWYAVIRTKDAGTELSATLCATKHQSEFLAKSINFVGTMRTVSGFHRRYQIDIHPTEIDAHT